MEKELNSLEKLVQSHSEVRESWRTQLEKYDYSLMCLTDILESRKVNGCNPSIVRPQLTKSINKTSFIKRRTTKNLDAIIQLVNASNPQILAAKKFSTNELPIVEEIQMPDNSVAFKQEISKLECELRETRAEMEYHKTMQELFVEELNNTRDKLKVMTNQVQEVSKSAEQSIRHENVKWQNMIGALKKNYDSELGRKQEAITVLHSQLSECMMKYMDLEKGQPASMKMLSKLLKE